MEYTIKQNKDFNSYEVYFNSKPSNEVLTALKELKMRWNRAKQCWYGFASEETIKKACDGFKVIQDEKTSQDFYGYPDLNKLTLGEFKTTEAGTMYEGWAGGQSGLWRSDKELKALILDQCKKANIKASIRFHRGGYTTALTATLYIKRSEILSFDEWLQAVELVSPCKYVSFNGWNYFEDENGVQQCVFGCDCENYELINKIKKYHYNCIVKKYEENRSDQINTLCELLKDPAEQRLNALQLIVDSFNSDNSNGYIDYFDRSIYDYYAIKIID